MPEIQDYLDSMYEHSRNASKQFQKDISYKTRDIPIFVSFLWESKQIHTLRDIPEIQNSLDLM